MALGQGCDCTYRGLFEAGTRDDAIAALGVQLTEDDIAYIEEPYTAHELVGPLSRPGEKALAGTLAPTLKETTRN